jgi:epoxide hydrolase-like predicted phosphatase
MTIRAVIWDIGGVLVRTEDRTPRRQLAESLGLTYEEIDDLVWGGDLGRQVQLGWVSALTVWQNLCQQVGLPFDDIPRLRRAFFAGDVLDATLVAYIRSLHPRYQVGVISNAMDDTRQVLEQEWGIQDAFNDIVISAEVHLMKPDPQIFFLALEHLQVNPQQAVFIDDFQHNVDGARAVGMQALRFSSTSQIQQELETLLSR